MQEAALRSATEWLLCASSVLGREFFRLPVAGQEEPEDRERVYCYELYHRWRSHWPDAFPYSLSGEVDKAGHPLIRGQMKPDFVVHIPGRMDNLLVVEVKPGDADRARIAEDLRKLTYFRRDLKDRFGNPANYFAAYLWLFGLPIADWAKLRDRLAKDTSEDPAIDLTLISCFVHESVGTRAVPVFWVEPHS